MRSGLSWIKSEIWEQWVLAPSSGRGWNWTFDSTPESGNGSLVFVQRNCKSFRPDIRIFVSEKLKSLTVYFVLVLHDQKWVIIDVTEKVDIRSTETVSDKITKEWRNLKPTLLCGVGTSTSVDDSFCTLKPKKCTSSSTCTVSKFLVCRRTINPFLSTMIYQERQSRTDTRIEAAHIAIPGRGWYETATKKAWPSIRTVHFLNKNR